MSVAARCLAALAGCHTRTKYNSQTVMITTVLSLAQGKALSASSHSIMNTNKKSDLMLMRCTRAYGSSCTQVILVYSIHFVAIHCFTAENH